MKLAKLVLVIGIVALVGGGYIASQIAWWQGSEQAMAYAAKVDQPPIRILASILFFGAIIVGSIPEKETKP